MNPEDLRTFLLEANNAGYASGNSNKWIQEKDKSTTIAFESGDFRMHDNFYGGEPYGGRMIVFYKNNPCWIMVYYGFVISDIDLDPVYKVLQQALKQMPEKAPFRGPEEWKSENYTYQNQWFGDIKQFSGKEIIFQDTRQIYEAQYLGGLVDIRKEEQ